MKYFGFAAVFIIGAMFALPYVSIADVYTDSTGMYVNKTEETEQKYDTNDEYENELHEMGQSVRTLNIYTDKLKEEVREAIQEDIEDVLRVVNRVATTTDESAGTTKKVHVPILKKVNKQEPVQASIKTNISKQIIKKKLDRKKEEINNYMGVVIDSSARGVAGARAVDAVLHSAVTEVRTIVHDEIGVDVSKLPRTKRVLNEVRNDVEKFEEQVQSLELRNGLKLYRDADEDGVSDYDETYIYFTDPKDAYTAGGEMMDGQRIMRGFDVHATDNEQVRVESPLESGEVSDALFSVSKVARVATEGSADALRFEGTALPNSFVTLYIFSTPIVVTVKADSEGKWEYVLDKQLENGEHSLYVASVNNAGKILAKSPRVPFTKTAEAVDFAPLEANVSEPTPLDIVQENMLLSAIFLFAVFILISTVVLGSFRIRHLSVG